MPSARSLVALSLVALVGCGTPSSAGQRPYVLPTRPEVLPAPSPPPDPPVKDPWLAYLTDVNPGSAVQFVTSQDGWRLDGQYGAPYLDGSLASGPNGTIFDWPGSSLSKSGDGGQHWTTIFAKGDAIWGFDVLSPKVGWVVGVTSLSRTDDGGATWKQVGEPAAEALVTVDFATADIGYGLTTAGRLARSVDGGESWSSQTLPAPASALCSASAQTGYVSDERGNVLRTDDGGATWTVSEPSPISADNLVPFWSQLSCNDDHVWQALRLLDPLIHYGGEPYAVAFSSDQGATWSAAAANSPDPGVKIPVAPRPFDEISVLAGTTSGDGFLVGWPTTGWSLQIEKLSATGGVTAGTVPTLDAGSVPYPEAAGYLEVHGATFVGPDGWVSLNDDAIGSNAGPETETILLHTADGGRSWAILEAGAPQRPPPMQTGEVPKS